MENKKSMLERMEDQEKSGLYTGRTRWMDKWTDQYVADAHV
jgi:hypothetical protein